VSAHPGPVASWSFEENRNSLRNSREIAYERPLVLVGRDDPFEHVTIPPNVATVGDVLSRSVTRVPSEAWLGVLARHPELRPDAVVTMGGAFVSKTLRQILRTWEFTHLHYGSTEAEVFARSVIETDVFPAASASWANQWRSVIERAEAMTASFWQSDVPFEFVAVRAVMESCNGADTLHLGNSLAVRIAGLVPSIPAGLPIFCNRGTSGIDGSLSTAVGHAIATPGVRHTVLLGDLAFFYDRNALWRDGLPGRLRVVILNNGEGAIFRALEGPARWGDAVTRWTTPHRRTAQWTAHDHGLHYRPVRNVKELAEAVSSENQDGPELIEVFTDPQETAAGFRRAIQFFREHTPL
jgi:2-succinyl-5-enolpyruvyl-6-hydroxy-3-cyclohexene-1-carboxylate synthase